MQQANPESNPVQHAGSAATDSAQSLVRIGSFNMRCPANIRKLLVESTKNAPWSLALDFWGAEKLILGSASNNESALSCVVIHHPGVLRELFLTADPLVFVDAFVDGYVDFEGDFENLVHIQRKGYYPELGQRQDLLMAWFDAWTLPRVTLPSQKKPAWMNLNLGNKERSKQTIQYHYDISNEFYELFLDSHMQYTCGYFADDSMNLERAQEAKLDIICRKLQLKEGEQFLDVGCGWGGLICWSGEKYGVKAHGITISQAQLEYARNRIAARGLSNSVTVELLDYRDLPNKKMFDKISSVGILEHIGSANYPQFFSTMFRVLKEDGLYLNHAIASHDDWLGVTMGERFMQRYIFPDTLPGRQTNIMHQMTQCGFEIVDVENWRPHYVRTAREWSDAVTRDFDRACALIGRKKVFLWRFCLLGASLLFADNHAGLFQTLVRRREDTQWNLPRNGHGWLCFEPGQSQTR